MAALVNAYPGLKAIAYHLIANRAVWLDKCVGRLEKGFSGLQKIDDEKCLERNQTGELIAVFVNEVIPLKL